MDGKIEGKEYWKEHNDYGLLESHSHRQTLLKEANIKLN